MNQQKEPVHICFICNETYVVPTCTVIQSIIESKQKDTIYHFHVVCASLCEESEQIFNRFESENIRIFIIREDADRFSSLHIRANNTMRVGKQSALLKFALPELLPDLDKVLYLDGDLFVRVDLSDLYETELSNNLVAAAPDCGGFFKEKLASDMVQNYFNSGVMLLNLKQMRIENTSIRLIEKKKELTGFNLLDQDTFNVVFDGRVVLLPVTYNFMGVNLYLARGRWTLDSINAHFQLNCKDVEELFQSWKIFHFASSKKPWTNPNIIFADKWYCAYRRSPAFGTDPNIIDVSYHRAYFADPADLKVPEGFDCVVPIAFACNENYAPYAGVAIQSVLESARPGQFYRVYVLHSGISDNMIHLLEACSTSNLSVCCLDVDMFILSKITKLYERLHYTKEMYYRFVIPEVLGFYSRVIYLDADLIVNRNIADILLPDMGDNLLAAVRNTTVENRRIELEEWYNLDANDYFNSGVLVFNIDGWKAENIEEKCFRFLETSDTKKLACPDQDILNIVCRDRILYLDEAWNHAWHMIYGDEERVNLCKARVNKIGENFYVLHFVGSKKPWAHPDLALSRYFWRHARNSLFYELILMKTVDEKIRKTKRTVKTMPIANTTTSSHPNNAFTFFPQKIKGGIQCYRDHGAGYTVRRTLYHMGLWEDEEAPKGPDNRPKLVKHAERIFHTKKGK